MRSAPKPLILIVEDEEELAKLIAAQLEESGMQTQIYTRCAHALRFLTRNFANLLLLDINLPDQSGFQLLEELKKNDITIPTIFLTGNTQEANKIRGLNIGGDDYITKPFSYPELVARIHAVLRRAEAASDLHVTKNVKVSDSAFEICGATVTPIRMEITFPNKVVSKLGRKELGILAYLNLNRHVIITRKALIHSVWGLHADVKSRSLDQYIVKVRELFRNNGLTLDCFRTVHSIGYIFEPPKPEAQAPEAGAASPDKV
jgi:DNA-binding response OmpR family regulator